MRKQKSIFTILLTTTALCFTACTSQGAASKEAVDLYDYRFITEEDLIKQFGFTQNDYGIYPSEDKLIFMVDEGSLYSIMLDESTIGTYEYLGISVGDTLESAEKVINANYTLLDSRALGTEMDNIYQDNIAGTLLIKYEISTDKIVNIFYMKEDSNFYMEDDITGKEDEIGEPIMTKDGNYIAEESHQETEDLDLSQYLADTPQEIIAAAGLDLTPEQGEILFYTGYGGGLSITDEDSYSSDNVSISLHKNDIGISLWGVKPGMDMNETIQTLRGLGHKIFYYKGAADNYFCFMEDYQCLCLIGDGQGRIDTVQYNSSPLKESDFGPRGRSEVWEGIYKNWDDVGINLYHYGEGSPEEVFVHFKIIRDYEGTSSKEIVAVWDDDYENVAADRETDHTVSICFLWNGDIKVEAYTTQGSIEDMNGTMFKTDM